ncbi:MAG: T9SS type A sorting domain-containing protein [Bacteroidota bacterium]|nr:T9SS type A sorting domain-containing protein [Bacteroidota bacterium]
MSTYLWDVTLGSWFGDFLVMKCDSFGDSLWATTYDGGYDDGTRGIVVDKFGGVIVFGASMDGYPGSQPPEQADYVTIKYSPTTDFEEISPNVFPSQYKINQNYPNPFNGNTIIRYAISTISNVNIKVFDILGREVTTLVNEQETPGRYSIQWDASGYQSGVYTYRLTDGKHQETKKLIILK